MVYNTLMNLTNIIFQYIEKPKGVSISISTKQLLNIIDSPHEQNLHTKMLQYYFTPKKKQLINPYLSRYSFFFLVATNT